MEDVSSQDEATLFQVIPIKDTTVTLANYDMNQKGGRERPNEPAVPSHCPGFGTWMKGQDLTFQQPSHPHLLFQKAARSLILKKISSWTRNDPVIAQRTIPGGPSPTLHVAGQDWRQEASQWPLKRNVHWWDLSLIGEKEKSTKRLLLHINTGK